MNTVFPAVASSQLESVSSIALAVAASKLKANNFTILLALAASDKETEQKFEGSKTK
jgi:hypothetical protein